MAEYKFSFPIKIRISDINYGNHVSYAYYLLYFQDARIAYLNSMGFAELNIGDNKGIIVSEVDCKYKRELLLGDEIDVKCRISSMRSKGFEMEYQIERKGEICATAKIVILCFDYNEKKIANLPAIFVQKVKEFEGIWY